MDSPEINLYTFKKGAKQFTEGRESFSTVLGQLETHMQKSKGAAPPYTMYKN